MNLVLVPVPLDCVAGTKGFWLPFVESIAEHSRSSVDELVNDVETGRVQVHLAWNPETKIAHALAGVEIVKYADTFVAVVIWATGSGRENWFPLLDEIERCHKEHQNCAAMKVICRPGWKRALQDKGYRMTHLVMEKDF